MLKSPPDGTQRVSIRLAYQDIPQALSFLEKAFGFPERKDKRLEGPHNSIIITEVDIDGSYIMLGPAGSHGIESPKKALASTESLMVYVDDIDEHFRVAEENGAEIIAKPSNQYWGDRRYEARDIEGHLWFFHQRVLEVPREEIDRIEAEFKNL